MGQVRNTTHYYLDPFPLAKRRLSYRRLGLGHLIPPGSPERDGCEHQTRAYRQEHHVRGASASRQEGWTRGDSSWARALSSTLGASQPVALGRNRHQAWSRQEKPWTKRSWSWDRGQLRGAEAVGPTSARRRGPACARTPRGTSGSARANKNRRRPARARRVVNDVARRAGVGWADRETLAAPALVLRGTTRGSPLVVPPSAGRAGACRFRSGPPPCDQCGTRGARPSSGHHRGR